MHHSAFRCFSCACWLYCLPFRVLRMVVPKKSLGQNFLRDENIARKIAGVVAPSAGDVILEIGPGTGVLTAHLTNTAGRYLGVELDPRSLELLRTRFPQAEFRHDDILNVRLESLGISGGSRLRIVGNIPYYITSEILFWIIDQRAFVNDATLMLQWEVARRLTAQPRTKDYGILAVVTQLYMDPDIRFKVSAHSFFPRPSVDSAVVHLEKKREVPEHPEGLLRTVVRGTFGKRRKTLWNSLRSMGFAEEPLREMPCDLTRRPEELTAAEFVELARELKRLSPSKTGESDV